MAFPDQYRTSDYLLVSAAGRVSNHPISKQTLSRPTFLGTSPSGLRQAAIRCLVQLGVDGLNLRPRRGCSSLPYKSTNFAFGQEMDPNAGSEKRPRYRRSSSQPIGGEILSGYARFAIWNGDPARAIPGISSAPPPLSNDAPEVHAVSRAQLEQVMRQAVGSLTAQLREWEWHPLPYHSVLPGRILLRVAGLA